SNPVLGQTVYLDYAGPDGIFGRLLPNGQPDPTDVNGLDDVLNIGTAVTNASGIFSVTVGQDAANTGLVPQGFTLPDTNVNVGPDGFLGKNPNTGAAPEAVELASYSLARVRVKDQAGNFSNPAPTDQSNQVRFVVDTVGPRITSASIAPGMVV